MDKKVVKSSTNVQDRLSYLQQKKKDLIKVMMVSSGIDLILSVPESLTFFQTLGGSVLVEEIVEYFISKTLAKHELTGSLKMTDKITGFIPVPGVTGLTIRCIKEWRKANKELKKLNR